MVLDASTTIRAALRKPAAPHLAHVELHRPSSELAVAQEYRFQDNFFAFGALGLVPAAREQVMPFKPGQVVDIIQDPGFTNADYNGFHTVTQIFSLNEFNTLLAGLGVGPEDIKGFDDFYHLLPSSEFLIFDTPFEQSTPPEGGVVLPVTR
jgi:hypothetical protein